MNSDLLIKIPNGSSEAKISLINEDGISQHKNITINDLISKLTASFKFSTGLLPNNTRFYSGSSTDYIIGIESPAGVRRFLKASRTNKKPEALNIPFPNCLFIFNIKNSKIRWSKLYSLKRPAYVETDAMYRFPFGNTYSDGRICWGNNKLKIVSSPIKLMEHIAMFYDAPFNGDLFDSETINYPTNSKNVNDFWSLLVYLDGKKIFPYEILKEMNIKLKSIMR